MSTVLHAADAALRSGQIQPDLIQSWYETDRTCKSFPGIDCACTPADLLLCANRVFFLHSCSAFLFCTGLLLSRPFSGLRSTHSSALSRKARCPQRAPTCGPCVPWAHPTVAALLHATSRQSLCALQRVCHGPGSNAERGTGPKKMWRKMSCLFQRPWLVIQSLLFCLTSLFLVACPPSISQAAHFQCRCSHVSAVC